MPSERLRRSTAGRRETILAGEALEQDESFWGHETWADEGSGNESFHSSDEDSALKRDEFDSDFDDTESDHEEDEFEAGEKEERELMRQERDNRSSSTRKYVDEVKSNKTPISPRKGKRTKGGSKRVVGEGLNAGIVLHVPTKPSSIPLEAFPSNVGSTHPIDVLSASPSVPDTKSHIQNRKLENKFKITAATTRPTRPSIRQGRQNFLNKKATSNSESGKKQVSSVRRKRRRYTQEELLMEAVTVTEPENSRWTLARKRIQAEQEKNKESFTREARGTVIERFVSRRGYLNTINFPDMDHVPPILSRNSQTQSQPPQLLCAISGKPARYRDPKTLMGYYDLAAFKELRRRFDSNDIEASATTNIKSQNTQAETKGLLEDLLPRPTPSQDATSSSAFRPLKSGHADDEKSTIKKARRGRPPKNSSTNPKAQSTQQSNIPLKVAAAALVKPAFDITLPSVMDRTGLPTCVGGHTDHASLKVVSNADSLNSVPDKAASTTVHVVENGITRGAGKETQVIVASKSGHDRNTTVKPTKIDHDNSLVEARSKLIINPHENGKELDGSLNLHPVSKTELKPSVYIKSPPLYTKGVDPSGNIFNASSNINRKIGDPVKECLSPSSSSSRRSPLQQQSTFKLLEDL